MVQLRSSNVIQFPPPKPCGASQSCDDVIKACEEIIYLARRGSVTGMMFSLHGRKNPLARGVAGTFLDNPFAGINEAALLLDELGKQVATRRERGVL
jgi:hypothetical protein